MIKNQILVFLLRWLVSSAGMWLVINLYGSIDNNVHGGFWLYVVAGLVFSLVNSIVRPLVVVMSLPMIIFSMGIFTLIINIAMMALAIWILPGVHIDFLGAALGALTMSVVNWLVNLIVPSRQQK